MKPATKSKEDKTTGKNSIRSSASGTPVKTPVASKSSNGSTTLKSSGTKTNGAASGSKSTSAPKMSNGQMAAKGAEKKPNVGAAVSKPLAESKDSKPKSSQKPASKTGTTTVSKTAAQSKTKNGQDLSNPASPNSYAKTDKTSPTPATSSSNSTTRQSSVSTNRPRRIDEKKKDVTSEFLSFFVDELKDVYWAEQALVEALPEIRDKASAPKLVEALDKHLAETNGQVVRLENIFRILGEEPESKTCKAMKGLIDEANDIITEVEDDLIRDAGIILASQKVEHYEIATYGTLVAFAKVMGRKDVVTLLEQTLQEEKGADAKLTVIAESFVNDKAVTESESSEEDDNGYFSFVSKWIADNF